jgi:hypothetical protein
MKFIISAYKDIWKYFWKQQLVYIPEEHSFYMDNVVNKVDIELIINTISLAVSDNIIVNVSGFCGLNKLMKSGKGMPDATFKGGMNYKVPGTYNGSKGIWELGINPETNTIYHFLFIGVK